MQAEIDRLSDADVPRSLTEIITLGRTLKRRAGDILAYIDHPHTSNGPTEAINGRLEHLRGSAPGLPKPHPLHHPSTPRNRRIQTPTTPPIMKSRIQTPTTPPIMKSQICRMADTGERITERFNCCWKPLDDVVRESPESGAVFPQVQKIRHRCTFPEYRE